MSAVVHRSRERSTVLTKVACHRPLAVGSTKRSGVPCGATSLRFVVPYKLAPTRGVSAQADARHDVPRKADFQSR